MKTIAFITQKGGAGKTTLVVSCAVVAQVKRNKILIIDTDPQGTAKEWYNDRPEALETPKLISIEPRQITEALAKADQAGFDFVLIDTAGRDLPSTKEIISLSDLVVIPCRPSISDMRASVSSVHTIQEAKKPFGFIINQAPYQPKRALEAIKSLQALGVVCPVPIVLRSAYQDAQAKGLGISEYEKNGKAHKELNAVWKWILVMLKKSLI